jgi:peroxiredoxin
MKYIFQIIAFTILISSYASAQPPAEPPAQTVPAFTFYKQDKAAFTNNNVAQNKPLFFFFFDTDCDHCQLAMTNLNQHYQDYQKAAIYLISVDDWGKINGFINKYAANLKGKANVTLLQDTKNEFIDKFKPVKYPSMFLYSPENKLIDYEDNEYSMFRFLKHLNPPVKKS